jgi:hypothetical protein
LDPPAPRCGQSEKNATTERSPPGLWRSRLISRARRWTGRRIRAIQLDCVEAGFAATLRVVNRTGSLDSLLIQRGWVWSGYIPSDTGIYTPRISLNSLITVTGEIIVPVFPSPKKQGGPQGIVTLILKKEGSRRVTVKIASGGTNDLSCFNLLPRLIVFN